MKGKSLNTRDMDRIDAWFANSFIESGKTEASELRTVIEDESRKRTQLPRARGADELFYSMYEQINDFDPAMNEELGGDFAANLNETLQRNVLYRNGEGIYYVYGLFFVCQAHGLRLVPWLPRQKVQRLRTLRACMRV